MKMRLRRRQPYRPTLDALNVRIGHQFVALFEAHAEYQREMIRACVRDIVRGLAAAIVKDGLIGKGGASVSRGPVPRNRWW